MSAVTMGVGQYYFLSTHALNLLKDGLKIQGMLKKICLNLFHHEAVGNFAYLLNIWYNI